MVFKLINYADVLVTRIACIGLILMYVSYRQSIGEINDAIDQVEEAERQKSELEREAPPRGRKTCRPAKDHSRKGREREYRPAKRANEIFNMPHCTIR
ncbi:MAG: hypothetical protein IPG67_06030 [Acidobacteria bacterium]|nr:hypothetical protein [Acidobacteriota bacterium]